MKRRELITQFMPCSPSDVRVTEPDDRLVATGSAVVTFGS